MNRLIHGDCLEEMDKLIEEGVKVDSIITDPPYGTTACKWDSVIPFDEMWKRLWMLIKPTGPIVLFAGEPFASALRMSDAKHYKYDWYWHKSKGCNFVHAKNMPLKFIENICVFSRAPIGHRVQLGDRRMIYNPQGLKLANTKWSRPQKYENGHQLKRESHKLDRVIKYSDYPQNVIKIGNSDNRERGLHPTQKPVALMEYLIKTYTTEGETILDFTMGSNSTGLACKNLGRDFIGIELDKDYFDIAVKRVSK